MTSGQEVILRRFSVVSSTSTGAARPRVIREKPAAWRQDGIPPLTLEDVQRSRIVWQYRRGEGTSRGACEEEVRKAARDPVMFMKRQYVMGETGSRQWQIQKIKSLKTRLLTIHVVGYAN
jgi:hypothetical protein